MSCTVCNRQEWCTRSADSRRGKCIQNSFIAVQKNKITKLKIQNNLIGRAGEQNTQHGMREIATQTNRNTGLEYTEGVLRFKN